MVVNPYLVAWTRSFLTCRSCRLLFQGSPKVFAPVSVRTPQGSTTSPLVFVIDVSGLHREIPDGLTLPYANDCTLTVSSDSYRRNVPLRQGHYAILNAKGSRFGVSFSIPETELIHWHMNRDRDPPSQAPIHADRSVFHLMVELRLLRLWFRPSLSTTPHFTKRLGKAQAAFVAVKRLPPPWDRPASLPLSLLGYISSLPHPELPCGRLLPDGPHGEKTSSLLAHGPEMV